MIFCLHTRISGLFRWALLLWLYAAGVAPAAVYKEADWSSFFGGLNGAAVVYDPLADSYAIYNRPLADTRRSPCSTFKIISALIALERSAIDPAHSTRRWSGETYWNRDWNHDMGLADAFRTSCVWYFRRIIDEIGPEAMQAELDKISYGNGDIADWQGKRNTNDHNRALTGFWIESSLAISPVEQVRALERIFGGRLGYSAGTLQCLRQLMLLPETRGKDVVVYGKTGFGKDRTTAVDAWFVGFAEIRGALRYFCVYLGETPGREITSAQAREIALQILTSAH